MCGPRRDLISHLEEAGYTGIEAVLFSDQEAVELKEILPRHRLLFKAVLWTAGRSVEDHLASLQALLTRALPLEPVSISVIGGYDGWTDDEAFRYFDQALKVEDRTGLVFSHETHRNSILFHPGITSRLLAKFPELKLVCDFSHWVVTCERLLDDQVDLIRECGRHATHLHVRVGTEQSPQVADIRSPEAAPYLLSFERWWETVWEEQAARGSPSGHFGVLSIAVSGCTGTDAGSRRQLHRESGWIHGHDSMFAVAFRRKGSTVGRCRARDRSILRTGNQLWVRRLHGSDGITRPPWAGLEQGFQRV